MFPVRAWATALVGVVLGALSAPADLLVAALAAPALLVRRVRGRRRTTEGSVLDRLVIGLAVVELRRVTRFHGREHTDPLTSGSAAGYLAVRAAIGLLGAGVLVLLVLFLLVALSMITAWLLDGDWALISDEGGVRTGLIGLAAAPGAVLIFLAVVGVSGVGWLERRLVVRVLGRRTERELRLRVTELARTRDDVLEAVDDERRRIERDIHDGLQQRVVAIGMLVGRARRATPDHAASLLDQAETASRDALAELREVAHRIRPAVLDREGLPAALTSLVERSVVPMTLDARWPPRLRPVVESVLYFVAAEALTNATKHAAATRIRLEVRPVPFDRVLLTVTDDGSGGADSAGTGLDGLARRVHAVDGELAVASPAGGPTTISVNVPCG